MELTKLLGFLGRSSWNRAQTCTSCLLRHCSSRNGIMVCEEGERAERLENLRGCWEAVVNEAENAVGLKRHGLAFRVGEGIIEHMGPNPTMK